LRWLRAEFWHGRGGEGERGRRGERERGRGGEGEGEMGDGRIVALLLL
jgi:hypothetical protein